MSKPAHWKSEATQHLGATAPDPNTSAISESAAADSDGRDPPFDPARDPAADLADARIVAQRDNKRIVLNVSGNWCEWSHILDQFFADNPDVWQVREANFVCLKVNTSEENENLAFLQQFPAIDAYPHLFVLDAGGNLLHSQLTDELEEVTEEVLTYNRERFLAFLKEWAP